MQLSNIPTKFQKAFGSGASPGNIRAIPVTTTDPDAASQTTGWPADAFQPKGAGGVPPDGRDMNGLDNMLSAWCQWLAAGGAFPPYDATFQAAIGGYPKTAIVGSLSSVGTYWQSTADNNTTNPDSGGAGWSAWPATANVNWAAPGAIGVSVPNNGVFSFLGVQGLLTTTGAVDAGTDLQISGVGFSQSFGTSGYQRLPSGLIMQFGRFFSATGNGDTINFPLSFPNNCTIATSSGTTTSSNRDEVNIQLTGPAYSSFKCWTWQNGSIASGVGVGWVAFGN